MHSVKYQPFDYTKIVGIEEEVDMAVGPRQTNSNSRYDANKDFTQDQLRRFGHVANQAQSNRDLEKKLTPTKPTRAEDQDPKPNKPTKNREQTQALRYAVWLSIALIALLSFMYVTG